jgi:hypothetical protein
MHYQGSKSKLSKQICDTLARLAPETEIVIEPFMGGANMSVRLAAWRPTIAGDACPGLADLHIAAREGFRLPACGVSLDEYAKLKALAASGDRSPYVMAVGFALSFGGVFFRGLGTGRDPRKAAFGKFYNGSATVLAAAKDLHIQPGVTEYHDWTSCMTPGVLVYCDPPYEGTCGYPEAPPWDTTEFYRVARVWQAAGARVFISELQAPFDLVGEYKTGCTSAQSVHALNRDFADRLYEVRA